MAQALQGIALEWPAGKGASGKQKAAQRLVWWRFKDSGSSDASDKVSQMQKALSSSLGVAIGEVLSQSLAGGSESAASRLQKIGCGRLMRDFLVPEGAASGMWEASNRMWVRLVPAKACPLCLPAEAQQLHMLSFLSCTLGRPTSTAC